MSRTRIDPSLLNNLSSSLNMGSNKIVSLANGTAATDATAFGQVKFLQVVYAQLTSTTSTTSTAFVTSGLAATITPTSASSKILILINASANYSSDGIYATIFRGITNLGSGLGAVNDMGYYSGGYGTIGLLWSDSPATTSATTYTFEFRSNGGGNVQVSPLGTSSMIVVEYQ